MSYSDLYLKQPSKPPVILFVIAMLAVLGFFVSFAKLPTTPTRAAKQVIVNHDLANVSPREATIFWETEKESIGWVIWGTSADTLNSVTLDERDLETNKVPSRYHFVRLKNLDENTSYFYKLVSDKEVSASLNNTAFTFTTPRNIPPVATTDPAYGKIIKPSGDAAANTLIRLDYPRAYPLVTIAKIDGAWLTPLPYLIDRESNKLITPDKTTPITLRMYLDGYSVTTVQATLETASPVAQTIILGSSYDLTAGEEVLSAATGEARLSPQNETQILFPKEKSIIPGRNPLIKGLAAPDTVVTVKINTKPTTSFDLRTNARGEWAVYEPVTINPGDYVMTVAALDNNKKPVALKRNFSIAKSGEQVLAAASDSGTLTPTTAPVIPTATTAPISTPQPTYAGGVAAVATMTPAPPVSGVNPGYFLGASTFLILLGAGLMLRF